MFIKPFMCLVVEIVHVFLKDSSFQASCPNKHTDELASVLKKMYPQAVGLILFTDGGPDHNNKHTSVRLGLLAFFWNLTWTRWL